MRLHPMVVLGLALAACGDGGDGDDGNDGNSALRGTCSLRAEVSGGTAIQFNGNDDALCATLHSFDTRLDGIFIGIDAKGTLELIVDGVTEGETGENYATRAVVTSTQRAHWQGAGCLSTIHEHSLVKTEDSEVGELRHYQVEAEGVCPDPLESVPAGADPVRLDTFQFRAQFTWRD